MTTKPTWLLFGAAVIAQVALAQPSHASTFELLHVFQGPPGDGAEVNAGVLLDGSGNIYGTTNEGGASTNCRPRKYGCGTVYKLTPDGTETVIHSFEGIPAQDGEKPYSAVPIMDAEGNLIATTSGGGPKKKGSCGTIFKMTPSGSETLLHTFRCYGGEGRDPISGVVADASGNLYGVTSMGPGTDCHGNYGCGSVFKLAPDGRFTTLYAFTGGADGATPYASLVLDDSGNLYGTTQVGGNMSCGITLGCGTVFKVAPDGTETVLHAFGGGVSDGAAPMGRLLRDDAGDLIGTTNAGGSSSNSGSGSGVVFKLASNGTETILHAFTGPDGQQPFAGVTADGSGNLYGTTWTGGDFGYGTVFKLTPDGTETVLHSFNERRAYGGGTPVAPLVMGADGKLYGTAEGTQLAKYGYGAVFRITP